MSSALICRQDAASDHACSVTSHSCHTSLLTSSSSSESSSASPGSSSSSASMALGTNVLPLPASCVLLSNSFISFFRASAETLLSRGSVYNFRTHVTNNCIIPGMVLLSLEGSYIWTTQHRGYQQSLLRCPWHHRAHSLPALPAIQFRYLRCTHETLHVTAHWMQSRCLRGRAYLQFSLGHASRTRLAWLPVKGNNLFRRGYKFCLVILLL